LALVLLIVTAILDKVLAGAATSVYILSNLGANLVIAWVTVQILVTYAKRERQRVGQEREIASFRKPEVEELIAQEVVK